MSDRRSGGAWSVAADCIDLRTTAGRLDRAADSANDCFAGVVVLAGSLPADTAVVSPGSALEVGRLVGSLSVGSRSLAGLGMRTTLTARSLRWSATAYERADQLRTGTRATLRWAAAPVVGPAVLGGVGVAWVGGYADGGVPGGNARAMATLTELLREHPELTYEVLDLARLIVPGVLAEGRNLFEAQVVSVVAVGMQFGVLRDDRPLTVRPVTPYARPVTRSGRPLTIAGYLDEQGALESDRAGSTDSRVRVHRIVKPDGSAGWVVQVPGTQDWSMTGSSTPSDGTANLRTMAALPSTLYPAIETALRTAMRQAGVPPGREPVMLVGHSQGGIVATRLAQDQRFRSTFRVTSVVTAGSPVSRMALPPSVTSFDVAHSTDVVPRTDAADSPDVLNRYAYDLDPTPEPGDESDLFAVHGARRYAASARRVADPSSTDPNVVAFYGQGAAFFDPSGTATDTVYDFSLQRPPAPPPQPP
ncbi:alpha/beta hydrolase [Calidifontibacter sp. DB0510]|uniref:Alpha/beta hydrolase n=1 Tax=Metallococcus carri TaxID=1656884 RepID=A0A967B397_9MICO|nr:alpha/beta hydrolase [Metallococcus carri]NHN56728.1 alpha/beta hydrolase [Metallococcus carri]NOP37895.1 hypothetical protein [Calidifontibacter sp. DB2511S]